MRDRDSAQPRSRDQDAKAQDDIAEGYRVLVARAEAAQTLRARQEAPVRADADRENVQTHPASATHARKFGRAGG